MEELLLINSVPTTSELMFLALISIPVALVLLAEFYYSKKDDEFDHFEVKNDDKYDPTLIDEKEAVKVSKKLKENAFVHLSGCRRILSCSWYSGTVHSFDVFGRYTA